MSAEIMRRFSVILQLFTILDGLDHLIGFLLLEMIIILTSSLLLNSHRGANRRVAGLSKKCVGLCSSFTGFQSKL